MGKFHQFLKESSAHDTSVFSFQDNNFSKSQWIFTKNDMFIDSLETWFGVANGQISSICVMAGYYRFTFLFVLIFVLF